MQPLRNERAESRTRNPWDQHEQELRQEDVAQALSDQDGVEIHKIVRSFATSCGCVDKPPGGYCADCPPETRPVCQECFSHCSDCGKPICRRHGSKREKCNDCHETGSRKQLTQRIVQTLVRPFVRFDDETKRP